VSGNLVSVWVCASQPKVLTSQHIQDGTLPGIPDHRAPSALRGQPRAQDLPHRIFATNEVVAKSRFWYFLGKLRKIKKANGEIVSVNQIHEKKPQKVKNFGIWLKYDSRSGTHNMYKEYREMSRVAAVDALYQDMAARHRSRFRQVQILKVVEVEKADDIRRPYIKQLLTKNLKFPLPHRINKKAGKKVFSATRPSTFF